MQRVRFGEFEPALIERFEPLWGKPVSLCRALANRPALFGASYSMVARVLDALRVQPDDDIRDYGPRLA